PRLLPVVPMMCREDERASRPQGPRRVPDDFRGHAQVADHRVNGIPREFMVWRLLDIAQHEFRVSEVPDARVRASVHELHAVQIHADDWGRDRGRDESEPPLARPDVQYASPAAVLWTDLLAAHRPTTRHA